VNLLEPLYSFWGWISGKSRFNAQVEALFAGFDYDAKVARTEALLAAFQPEAEAQRIKSVTRELIPSEYLCPRQKCQGVMIKRGGRYGSFYGCSEYPLCGSTTSKARCRGIPVHSCGEIRAARRPQALGQGACQTEATA
jgi:hypothetical protein